MNSPLVCLDVPPRTPRAIPVPPGPRVPKNEPPGDELRKLAFEIVEHDPVLAHLLVRAGERMRRS